MNMNIFNTGIDQCNLTLMSPDASGPVNSCCVKPHLCKSIRLTQIKQSILLNFFACLPIVWEKKKKNDVCSCLVGRVVVTGHRLKRLEVINRRR